MEESSSGFWDKQGPERSEGPGAGPGEPVGGEPLKEGAAGGERLPGAAVRPPQAPDDELPEDPGLVRLRRRRLTLVGAVFLVLVVLGFGLRYVNRSKPAQEAEGKVPLVVAARAGTGDVQKLVRITGRVAAEVEISVTPKISGRIKSVSVDVGDRVHRGQVLVTLEDTELAAALHSAQAALEVAEAGARAADAALANAKANLERMQQLYDAGAASKQQLEQAELAYQQASAGVAAAQVEQARAGVEAAKANLANCVIVSPIDGVVGARSADPGALAVPGTPLLTLEAMDTVEVTGSVTEDDVNKLQVGEEVPVLVEAAGSRPFAGRISSIAPAADAKSRMYPIKISIPNQAGVLKPGMFAELELVTEVHRGVLRVPLGAVLNRDGRDLVYVVRDGKVEERIIKKGISDNSYTEVVSGLKAGEVVVCKGQDMLADGARVRVSLQSGKGAQS